MLRIYFLNSAKNKTPKPGSIEIESAFPSRKQKEACETTCIPQITRPGNPPAGGAFPVIFLRIVLTYGGEAF